MPGVKGGLAGEPFIVPHIDRGENELLLAVVQRDSVLSPEEGSPGLAEWVQLRPTWEVVVPVASSPTVYIRALVAPSAETNIRNIKFCKKIKQLIYQGII